MCPSPDNAPTPPRDDRRRILVVDDEPTLRLGFAYALTTPATLVETAATGRVALEMMADARFDVVILDLRMPELDGNGVIARMRAGGNRTPVVLCSAALSPRAALEAIQLGVVDFLLKPVRPTDLRQIVEQILRPEGNPLAQALKAARRGRVDEAIDILESVSTPDRRGACWLGVLRSVRSAAVNREGATEDTARLEGAVRTNLSVLAFNADPP